MTKLTQAFVCLILCLSTSLLFLSCKKTDKANSSTVTSAPFPPTDLTATVISINQVNLNWIDKSTNEAGFKLERKTATTNFASIATLGPDITTYSDNGLTPNTTYTYRVYSYNSVGNSPTYSNEVTVTTIGLPSLTTSAVTNFTAVDGVSGGVIATDGGAPVTARGVVWSTSQNPTVALSTKTTDGSGTGTFTSTITGLTATTKYYVRAYATNAAGTAYGNEVNFTTNTIDLKNGLIAYYPFSGNAGDSSGNGNHGTVNGATLTTDRFGKINAAFVYDGINNYIKTNQFFNASQSFTISCWVNSNSSNNQVIVNTIPHTILGYGLNPWWIGSGKIGFLYGTGQSAGWINNNYYFTNPNPFLNIWVNHTVVKNGFNWSFYQNGILINNYQATAQPAGIISNLVFGHCDPSICTETFSGKLDDFRIYNRALTQEEITYLSKQ